MTHVPVRICDKDQTDPAFPEFETRPSQDGELAGVAVLEDATSGGKAGVGFVVVLADGSTVRVMTTAAIFGMVAGAVKGACQRWGQDI